MADDKKPSGKTRAGTPAKPFPYGEALSAVGEAISEQYGRTKSRLKGLATEPEAELQRILEQYLPKKGDSPEERMQKLEDLAMGFAGTTKLPPPKLMRASEVFGPHEGKTAMFTESDRTKVGGGFLGGPGFSSLQLELPAYEGKAWGVASMPKAKTIIASNERVPEGQAIWSTYLGHPEQHRSNQMVFDQILNQFRREAKKGNLPKELQEKINDRLAAAVDKDGKPIFPPDVDVMAKNFRQLASTFDRRAVAADVMGGKGVGGKKGSIIDYPGIIESTTDPALVNAPTWSVGNRAFTLTGDVSVHPELQPAFPYLLHGEDLGKTFDPLPKELAFQQFIEKVRKEKGRDPGYMDFSRGFAPQQFISEEWLTALQKAGKKDGGAVKKAEGGTVNYELPDDVTPQNWRDQLETNVLNDARALIGVKEGGPINLDRLLEKAVRKANGGPANLDDMLSWAVAKHNHKMKKGGEVSQTFPLKKDEEEERMFSPAPLKIPEPITDALEALKRQFEKEKRSMSKPGAVQDVLMRGPVAMYAGAPADILGMGGELLDYVQKKIPGMRKPASVMDTGPEKVPPMGYAPAFPLTPNEPYGTEAAQELMKQSGLTTGTERPLLETGTGVAAPFAGMAALKTGKALAPTAAEMLEFQLAQSMKPYQMAIAPEGKAGKVKAPANPVGFYNPAEKAALNLQRKQGAGSAFVSDLQKTPGVNQERLGELGLGDLASRSNVTRDEILTAAEQNRIPLRETVSYEHDQKAIDKLEDEYEALVREMEDAQMHGTQEEFNEMSELVNDNLRAQKKLKFENEARFGPQRAPEYSLPGGENYREIRVALPSNKRQMSYEDWRKSGSTEEWSSKGIVGEDFTHKTHHGDEPNVLFHLRVADHTDAEGKKGLLIDELQSDWHQKGREKGYGDKLKTGYSIVEQEPGFFSLQKEGMSMPMAYGTKDRVIDRARYYNAFEKGVPDAPFKDNWYQLGLKRAIKEAADTGMDRVYLTTGARQADRYDLSKHIDELAYQDGTLHAYKDGQLVIDKTGVPQEKLQDYVGKEAAKKLIDQKPNEYGTKSLGGLDLKVGGEGMKQYYDKTYKNYLDKYAKQFGGRVGETTLPQASDIENVNQRIRAVHGDNTANIFGFRTTDGKVFESRWDAIDHEKRISNVGEKVYYIDITPKMIESAKKGQSYAFGGGVFNTDPDITDSGRIIPEHTI
jgi:hypothetical protein